MSDNAHLIKGGGEGELSRVVEVIICRIEEVAGPEVVV